MRQLSSSLTNQSQVAQARREAIHLAEHAGFNESCVDKVADLATELATNLLKHAIAGQLLTRVSEYDGQTSFEFISLDRGPGIANISKCSTGDYSTDGSLGTGLGAIARIADHFDSYSHPKKGTVAVARIVLSRVGPTIGVVHQAKQGESISGDAWLVKAYDGQTLCVVADGLGHGLLAATAANAVIDSLKLLPSLKSPSDMIEVAHQAAKATVGAAVGIAILDHNAQGVRFAGVGNISTTVVSSEIRHHLVSYDGIVGHYYRKVMECTQPWSKESIFVMHSDGLTARWDLNDYPGLGTKDPSLIAGLLYRDFSRPHDDTTVIILKNAA